MERRGCAEACLHADADRRRTEATPSLGAAAADAGDAVCRSRAIRRSVDAVQSAARRRTEEQWGFDEAQIETARRAPCRCQRRTNRAAV